jgi:polyhydroxyalkanoate synthesis regulator phasin
MPNNEPVTIESLNAELADLEREVRALSNAQPQSTAAPPPQASSPRQSASGERPSANTEDPASRVEHAAQIAAEDTAAASFVATQATIDRTGGWFVTLSELGGIHNDQTKAFLKDAFDTLKALRNAHSAADVLQVTFDHLQRRAAHIADGLNRATDVIVRESRHASESVGELWRPVIDLVRTDVLAADRAAAQQLR